MFSGSSMFKRLPLADGEDESETETEEQDSEVETGKFFEIIHYFLFIILCIKFY